MTYIELYTKLNIYIQEVETLTEVNDSILTAQEEIKKLASCRQKDYPQHILGMRRLLLHTLPFVGHPSYPRLKTLLDNILTESREMFVNSPAISK